MDHPFPPGVAGAARFPMPGTPTAATSTADAPAVSDVIMRFIDPGTGQVNVPALIAAFEDLARRLPGMVTVPGPDADIDTRLRFRRALGIPDTPDAYRVSVGHPGLAVDPEVNQRLHEAGFTPEQVQLVYDLAVERVMPVIEAMGETHRAETDLAALVEHFGGEERWAEVSRQVSAWGKAHLPEDVYRALASTREGVMALFRMMAEGEPTLAAGGGAGMPAGGAPGEEDLKALMRDPRYWKQRDPAVVRRVAEGFRRLYPGGV
jgi:hypothetical protein